MIPALTVTLFALLPASAADPKIKVACIGDSITFGAGVENREKNSYPAVLQTLLGDGYQVRNFGVSGRTLLTQGDFPYTKEKAYTDALAFQPNIVVIKLGTNDSKPQNWKYADEFVTDYKTLVAKFQGLESKPKVFVCTPVPVYGAAFGISNKIVMGEVKPKIEVIAKELKLPLIDLYAALSDNKELFPDKVHPNAAGAKLMAEVIAAALAKKE